MKSKPLRITCANGHGFLAPVSRAGNEVCCPYCGLLTSVPRSARATQPPKVEPGYEISEQSSPLPISHASEASKAKEGRETRSTDHTTQDRPREPATGGFQGLHATTVRDGPASSVRRTPRGGSGLSPPGGFQTEYRESQDQQPHLPAPSRPGVGLPELEGAEQTTTRAQTAESLGPEAAASRLATVARLTPEVMSWSRRIYGVQREGLVLAIAGLLTLTVVVAVAGILAAIKGLFPWAWLLFGQAVLCLGSLYVVSAFVDWTTTRTVAVVICAFAVLYAGISSLVTFGSPDRLRPWNLTAAPQDAQRWTVCLTFVHLIVALVLFRVAFRQHQRAQAFFRVVRRHAKYRK